MEFDKWLDYLLKINKMYSVVIILILDLIVDDGVSMGQVPVDLPSIFLFGHIDQAGEFYRFRPVLIRRIVEPCYHCLGTSSP